MRAPSDLLESDAPLVPLFVYGTLRSFGALHQRYIGAEVVDAEYATAMGYALRDAGMFPLMVREAGQATHGEVMWMRADSPALRRTIEMEVATGYALELVEVEVASTPDPLPVLAFVWQRDTGTAARVPFNDWMAT